MAVVLTVMVDERHLEPGDRVEVVLVLGDQRAQYWFRWNVFRHPTGAEYFRAFILEGPPDRLERLRSAFKADHLLPLYLVEEVRIGDQLVFETGERRENPDMIVRKTPRGVVETVSLLQSTPGPAIEPRVSKVTA